jgi:hypothetical protein
MLRSRGFEGINNVGFFDLAAVFGDMLTSQDAVGAPFLVDIVP